MKIRAADHTDAVALVPLFNHWDHPQTEDQVRAILASWSATPLSQVLVADAGTAVAGMAAVSAAPRLADLGRNATLAGLVVVPDYQRRGVAGLLLGAAEDLARGWGCARLELTSSRDRAAAHQFYPSRGYQETSKNQARYVQVLRDATALVGVP